MFLEASQLLNFVLTVSEVSIDSVFIVYQRQNKLTVFIEASQLYILFEQYLVWAKWQQQH